MQKLISLDQYQSIYQLFNTLITIGLLEPYNVTMTWEKKSGTRSTIMALGDFELTNPEEVYAFIITFFDKDGFKEISKTRLCIRQEDRHGIR